MNSIPLALTLLRALLAPVMVALTLWHPSPALFGLCLVVAFLSDVFDGIIARRLGVATANLRRADSIADSIFYLGAVFAAWWLHREVIYAHSTALLVLLALELLRYAFDFAKFGKEASYHMWSSKAWGVGLLLGFLQLLAWGQDGVLVAVAIYVGIAADLEGLGISLVLKRWQTDVPSLVHALRLRANS
ncbi:MAG TPA: CDP-alcohol phosphatidyltransferase family protein [Burkholderiaceae bacterium]